MKITQLFESPQLTYPQEFGLDDDSYNLKLTRDILQNSKKQTLKKFGNDAFILYELGDRFILIDHGLAIPRIVYMMQYKVTFHKFIGRKCAQQILIWRDLTIPDTKGIAEYIFFEHLLYKYKTVITDAVQTEDGKSFWDKRIGEAIQRKNCVYYVSLIPNREITRITSAAMFRKLRDDKQIWGDESKHMARRIIITESEIFADDELTNTKDIQSQ